MKVAWKNMVKSNYFFLMLQISELTKLYCDSNTLDYQQQQLHSTPVCSTTSTVHLITACFNYYIIVLLICVLCWVCLVALLPSYVLYRVAVSIIQSCCQYQVNTSKCKHTKELSGNKIVLVLLRQAEQLIFLTVLLKI